LDSSKAEQAEEDASEQEYDQLIFDQMRCLVGTKVLVLMKAMTKKVLSAVETHWTKSYLEKLV